VTAAALLSVAAFEDGLHAQAFPTFGSERMGAPVEAYCRVATEPIRTREPVVFPDALVIQDPTLLHQVDLLAGLKPDGYVLINTKLAPSELGLESVLTGRPDGRVLTVDATALALEFLQRPTPNSALLGGFCAMVELVTLAALVRALEQRFPGAVGARNAEVAQRAFALVNQERTEVLHAPSD